MHPLARVFQIVLLVAGVALAGIGYIIYYDDFQQNTSISFNWDCQVRSEVQECRSVNGSLDAGSRDEGLMNIGFGLVLVLAGGVVSIGGRRRADQSAPVSSPAPVSGPPQPVYQGPPPPPQQAGPVPPQRF
ncbi:hypothetical protein AB0I28_29290 [Phytomonospora sp. NPDC050363]|uniref:hypothetical protein n=1 Tax=Phytomonospora sp. NPDC050363 TaxID=3155642 RepID=UPI0033FE286E